jgi:hypothetical protein
MIPAVFLVFLAVPAAFGQNTSPSDAAPAPLQFRFPRSDGLGGVHAALADDFETLFVNPAGISTAEDQFSVAMLNVKLIDIDTTLRLVSSGFTDTSIYADIIKTYFEAGVDITGPLAVGYIRGDAGLGLINRQYLKIWWDRNDIFVVNADVAEEIAFYLGGSLPATNFEQTVTFTPGITIKPMVRAVFAPRGILIPDFRHILQNLQNEPFELQMGAGVDLGFLVSFSDIVYFSVVLRDIISPLYVNHYANFEEFINGAQPVTQGVKWVKPAYDFSVCARTKNTFATEVLQDIALTVDYYGLDNLLEQVDRDPLMDIGAGIELHLLRAFRLRAGMRQLLPCAGFGIDVGWAKLDAAVFGETFGNYTNDYQSISFSMGLAFRY